ncbi:hypothetical protein [Corynebacterium coyleae]|uniref:hypothetical protein n=1 Tax=Corynebacterium coyleae TaxID=53374 RepID=UPI00254EE10E|nr:hypothetical protein [Corynebacterium coyleae]MDK8242143.1 hypothetical protein [Corynebacterium coyleae]
MNNQEKLARQWAEKYLRYADESDSAELYAAAQIVKANTTKPTMADVEWDVDEMPGTGALTKHGRLWIMRDDVGDAIECISPNLAEIAFVAKKGITPNGKRYELREVGDDAPEPSHPEVLKTVEDYEDAPEGTVVDICGTVAIRQRYGWCVTGYRYKLDNDEMFQQGEGVAVRWGE